MRDVSEGEACPTDSGFEANQDRANIAKNSTLPHESTSRVTSLATDEDSMQHKLDELMTLCTSLQRQHSKMVARFEAQRFEIKSLKAKIQVLENKYRGVAEQSGDDALIKGRRLDVGEEAAKRVSDDTEEMATVLTSMDAATVLLSGVAEVPTGSGSIPTAGPPATGVPTDSDVVPTAGPPATGVPTGSDVVPTACLIFATAPIVTPYTRRKGKETMEYHQFAIELPIERRIELISDLVRYQYNYAKVHKYPSQQRKPLTKKQQKEFYTLVLRNQAGWKAKHFKGMTLEEIKENFDPVWKQIHDFISIGSKEEAERFKRKRIRFKQESTKKLKTSEEVPEEVKSPDEVHEEKVKEMMQLVPIEEHLDIEYLNQLWALVKEALNIRPASSDKEMELWVELKRLVHYVTSKDNEIFILIEKDYPLRKGLAIVMISYKLQVENYSQMANDLILKIYKIASSLRQQVMEFPLPKEVPIASEESFHCQKKRDATAEKIALLLKSSSSCQSKSNDSFAKKNDVKARTTLLLSLPDEHQLRFSKYKTAQELWATLLKTFGGNEATKKTKKNLLKQQYGNFKVEGSETLEQTCNRILAPEWIMHTIVWRNRSDLDTTSLDDLYNHLKIDKDDMEEMDIKWNMALLNIRADRFWKTTRKKISIQRTDVAGFDKSKGEGSGTPTEPHHTPSLEAQQTSPTTHSSPTLPSDRENIAKTSTLPHESTSRVTSLAADEGSMQHKLDELTALCTSLQRQHSEMVARFKAQGLEITSLKARIQVLENKDKGVAEQSRDDAPIKDRRLDVGEEAAKRVSEDPEGMATVLTSMDAATVLLSGVAEVPTGSGSVLTVGPPATGVPTGSDVVPTAGPPATGVPTGSDVVPTTESETLKKKKVQEQIDAQVARELEEKMVREDQRMSEQIARDAEIARIHAEEELQIIIDGLDRNNETVSRQLCQGSQIPESAPLTKKQQREFYTSVLRNQARWKAKHFKGMTLEEIKENFDPVWKQIHDFIPIGSKEEVERFKRKGIRFEQESTKKLKTPEEVPEEVKSPDEVPEEKVKEMMQLVPIKEVYVESLQVKHPIIDWKVHTEGQRNYWKIIRLRGSSASYQFFEDLLKHLDR
uniref:Ribonuclease H-like domain-containing protein n=1 Tax=Tanacetum cinerariifolium TaxID=118510 RepID=A0A699I0H4_TANCI|nr:ribonuclease H-like domain-containing protein [Tanacetum cinerariifolium]